MKSPIDGVSTTLVTGVQYEPFGPPRQIYYANGLISVRYRQTDSRPWLNLLGNYAGALDYRQYSYDDVGNLTSDQDFLSTVDSRSYAYDEHGRLIYDSYVDATGGPTYDYDGNGNRLARRSSLKGYESQNFNLRPRSNRIARLNGRPVSHDGAGNLLDNGDGTRASYNAANRLWTLSKSGDSVFTTYNGIGELARSDFFPELSLRRLWKLAGVLPLRRRRTGPGYRATK